MTETIKAEEYRKQYAGKRSRKNDLNINEMLAAQLKSAGIPFEREVRFHGTRKWRMDFHIMPLILQVPLFVELHGGTWAKTKLGHSHGIGLRNSYEKLNEAAIMRCFVLQFDSQQVRDGVALQTIQRALGIGANKNYKAGKGH